MITFKKTEKKNRPTRFEDVQIGQIFEYKSVLYLKVNRIDYNLNVFNFTTNSLTTFGIHDTICNVMDAELTYWERS